MVSLPMRCHSSQPSGHLRNEHVAGKRNPFETFSWEEEISRKQEAWKVRDHSYNLYNYPDINFHIYTHQTHHHHLHTPCCMKGNLGVTTNWLIAVARSSKPWPGAKHLKHSYGQKRWWNKQIISPHAKIYAACKETAVRTTNSLPSRYQHAKLCKEIAPLVSWVQNTTSKLPRQNRTTPLNYGKVIRSSAHKVILWDLKTPASCSM